MSKEEKLYNSALDDYYHSKLDSSSKTRKGSPTFMRKRDSANDCINLTRLGGKQYPDLEITLQKAEYIPHKIKKLSSDINKISQKLHRVKVDIELGYSHGTTEQNSLEQRLQKLVIARKNLLENQKDTPSIDEEIEEKLYHNYLKLHQKDVTTSIKKEYVSMMIRLNTQKMKRLTSNFDLSIESITKGKNTTHYYTKKISDILRNYDIIKKGSVTYGDPPEKPKRKIKKTKPKGAEPKKQTRKKIIKKSSIDKTGGSKKNITWNTVDSDGKDIVDHSTQDLEELSDFSSVSLDGLETINIDESDEEADLHIDNDNDHDHVNNNDNNNDIENNNLIGGNIVKDNNVDNEIKNIFISQDKKINEVDNDNYKTITIDNTTPDILNTDSQIGGRLPTEKPSPVSLPSLSPSSLSPVSVSPPDLSRSQPVLQSKPSLQDSSPVSPVPQSTQPDMDGVKNIQISSDAFDATNVANTMTEETASEGLENLDTSDMFKPIDTSYEPPSPILKPVNNEITIDTQPQIDLLK